MSHKIRFITDLHVSKSNQKCRYSLKVICIAPGGKWGIKTIFSYFVLKKPILEVLIRSTSRRCTSARCPESC